MAKRVRSGGRPPSKRGAPRRPATGPTMPVRRPPDLGVNPEASASIEPREPIEPAEPLEGEVIEAGPDELPKATGAYLTDAEVRRAEQIQADIAAQERAAIAEQLRRRNRARTAEPDLGDINAPLRVRASHEYAYVARDVRRIILTGGIMVAILAVLAIAINGFGVISI